MNEPAKTIRDESRWPPALAILLVLFLMATLPGHIIALPVWVSYVATLAVLCADGRRRAHRRKPSVGQH